MTKQQHFSNPSVAEFPPRLELLPLRLVLVPVTRHADLVAAADHGSLARRPMGRSTNDALSCAYDGCEQLVVPCRRTKLVPGYPRHPHCLDGLGTVAGTNPSRRRLSDLNDTLAPFLVVLVVVVVLMVVVLGSPRRHCLEVVARNTGALSAWW